MSTPALSADQLRIQNVGLQSALSRYKEAAVNLPLLVKKYKSLEGKHAELQKKYDSAAADLERFRELFSSAKGTIKTLQTSLNTSETEKVEAETQLAVCKRENKSLQSRLLEAGNRVREGPLNGKASSSDHLVQQALGDVAGLRQEMSVLRKTMASCAEQHSVSRQLSEMKAQLAHILQHCAREEGLRGTRASRACTPAHESLASPPLQSLMSLHAPSASVHELERVRTVLPSRMAPASPAWQMSEPQAACTSAEDKQHFVVPATTASGRSVQTGVARTDTAACDITIGNGRRSSQDLDSQQPQLCSVQPEACTNQCSLGPASLHEKAPGSPCASTLHNNAPRPRSVSSAGLTGASGTNSWKRRQAALNISHQQAADARKKAKTQRSTQQLQVCRSVLAGS
jgi:hypothetical protein